MKIIGHRGARGLAPENTKASFDAALRHGVDFIEFDVRLSSDGAPVVIHDPFVLHQGKKLKIARHSLQELKKISPSLLTLDEALRHINRRRPIVIEVKPGMATNEIAAVIRSRLHNGWQPADIRIASFDLGVLQALKQSLPELIYIVNEKWSGVRASYKARKLGTIYLAMNQRWLWSGFIRSMSNHGYKLACYTLDDPKKAARWKSYGLYGVVTDFPDRY